MNQCISLVEALTPRAVKVAELLSGRMSDAGLWSGYKQSEGLNGVLKFADLLEFHRPTDPLAKLVFRNPKMSDVRQVHRSDPVVLEENVNQRFRSHIVLAQPASYSKTLSHTWGETVTLDQQVKVGAEATVKAGLTAGVSGVSATGELSAKIYAEYLRRWGKTETQSDTISDTFYFVITEEDVAVAPKVIDYEATREINREQRTITADCDYEHSVELLDETGAGVNPPRIQLVLPSWSEFRNVVQGFAAANTSFNGRVFPTAFYSEFCHDPIRGERLEQISAPADGSVQFQVEYQNVLAQEIRLV